MERSTEDEVVNLTLLDGLPYPWTSRPGLTACLNNAKLWANAFPQRAEPLRDAIKAAAKSCGIRRSIAKTDDHEIGKLCCELLSRTDARAELQRQIEKRTKKGQGSATVDISTCLYAFGLHEADSEPLPKAVMQDGRRDERIFLDPAKLKSWLSSDYTVVGDQERTVTAIAAFAILQPKAARDFALAVLGSAELRTYLLQDLNEPASRRPLMPPSRPEEDGAPPSSVPHTNDVADGTMLASSSAANAGADPKWPEALRRLHARLDELHLLSEQVKAKVMQNSMSEVALSATQHAKMEAQLREHLPELMKELRGSDPDAADLPPPREWATDRVAGRVWLERLEYAYKARGEARAAAVARARDALLQELQELQIPVPSELEAASTLGAVEKVRQSLSRQIAIADAIRRCSSHVRTSALSTLDASQRLHAMRVLAQRNVAGVIEVLVDDSDSKRKHPSEYFSLALEIVMQRAFAGEDLPVGVWHMLRTADDTPIDDDPRVAALLARLPDRDDIDIAGLSAALSLAPSCLPPAVASRICVLRAEGLPVLERISTLARAWSEQPNDKRLVRNLLAALGEAGRFREAVYLATLAARRGSLSAPDDESLVRTLSVHLLIDAAIESQNDPLQNLTTNLGWMIEDDEGAAVLLWLLDRSDSHDLLTNLRYQHPARVRVVQRRWPAFASALLERLDAQGENDGTARAALSELREALKKPSCYASWSEAKKYQVYFRQRLEKLLRDGSQAVKHVSAEDIVDEAQADGDLAEVVGAGRLAMIRFISEQISRIAIVHATGKAIDDLAAPLGRRRDELEQEAASVPAGTPLRRVYDLLLERST